MGQMEAKERMTRDARFQKASSLKATGRASNDEFEYDASRYMHCYGSESKRVDEQNFAVDNSLLRDFENGRLVNPYDLSGSGEGGSPGVRVDLGTKGAPASDVKKRRTD